MPARFDKCARDVNALVVAFRTIFLYASVTKIGQVTINIVSKCKCKLYCEEVTNVEENLLKLNSVFHCKIREFIIVHFTIAAFKIVHQVLAKM